MHEALAELAAGAIRPVLAQAVARLERAAALMSILAGCGLLIVAAVIGMIAAGAVALAPAVGTAGAIAIGAGFLLLVSITGGLLTRRALIAGDRPARPGAEPASDTAKTGTVPSPAPAAETKAPFVDPTLVVAVCATAAILLGPSRLLGALRGTVEVIRLAASLMAGAELVKSLDQLAGAFGREDPANAVSAAARSAASGTTQA